MPSKGGRKRVLPTSKLRSNTKRTKESHHAAENSLNTTTAAAGSRTEVEGEDERQQFEAQDNDNDNNYDEKNDNDDDAKEAADKNDDDDEDKLPEYRIPGSVPIDASKTLHSTARNLTISFVFLKLLNAPDPSQWTGKMGTIPFIKGMLNIPKGTRIEWVLHSVWKCYQEGRVFDGKTNEVTGARKKREPKLKLESEEAQLAARLMFVDGFSQRRALKYMNEWFLRQNRPEEKWTFHTVFSLSQRLKASGQVVPASEAE